MGLKNNNIQGVPRLSEVINASKNIKTPSLEVYLKPDAASDKNKAKHLQSKLESCMLSRIVAQTEVHYDPDLEGTVLSQDADMMRVYGIMPDEETQVLRQASPWVLRMVIDREMLVDKGGFATIHTQITRDEHRAVCAQSC